MKLKRQNERKTRERTKWEKYPPIFLSHSLVAPRHSALRRTANWHSAEHHLAEWHSTELSKGRHSFLLNVIRPNAVEPPLFLLSSSTRQKSNFSATSKGTNNFFFNFHKWCSAAENRCKRRNNVFYKKMATCKNTFHALRQTTQNGGLVLTKPFANFLRSFLWPSLSQEQSGACTVKRLRFVMYGLRSKLMYLFAQTSVFWQSQKMLAY